MKAGKPTIGPQRLCATPFMKYGLLWICTANFEVSAALESESRRLVLRERGRGCGAFAGPLSDRFFILRSCLLRPHGGGLQADVAGKRWHTRGSQDHQMKRGPGVFARGRQQATDFPIARAGRIEVGADLDMTELSFLEG